MNTYSKKMMMGLLSGLLVLSLVTPVTGAEQRTITLATVNWEPFYSETLPAGGYFTDLVREAFQQVGYTLDMKWVPWKRAMERAKKGDKYHGVLGASYRKEREVHFVYSEVIDVTSFVFIARKGHRISYQTLSDLKQYVIGGMRGSVDSVELLAAGFQVEEVTTDKQNILKLLHGRIDLVTGGKRTLQLLINTEFAEHRSDIVFLSPPLKNVTVHIIVSKKVPDHETIIADFNRGLGMIKADGRFDQILQKHGFGEQKE